MTIEIDWADLLVSKRLNDNDVVSVTFTPLGDNSRFEIELQLAAHKSWWKAVQVLDNTDAEVATIEVHDDTRQAGPISVNSDDVEVGGTIVLCKAKAFGLHTGMYHLADLERCRGNRVTFRWSAD